MNASLRLQGALVFLLLLAVGTRALAAASSVPLPENPVGGSAVFVEKQCLRCHAVQGYGGSEGPDLGRVQLRGGFLGMAGFMWNHAPKMIVVLAKDKLSFPKVTTGEMKQLVAFLYTLNYLDPPGDPRRGEQVFAAKGCLSCHRVGGLGGAVAPPLDKYGSYASPLFLATELWNRGPAMAEAMKREQIPRPVLGGGDVRDIVAFIRARGRRSPGSPPRVYVPPGNPKEGASLFQSKRCGECHSLSVGGKEDAGRSGAGPPLVAREFKVNLSAIAGRMWNHGPGMWSQWKAKGLAPISLSVKEMADLTAYLYFLQFESPLGDPARGAVLYRSRGCERCHEPEKGAKEAPSPRKTAGKEEDEAPDLRAKGPWASDIDLAREMWNHAGKMYGKILEGTNVWPRLAETEVADLLSYVRSIGGTRKKK